MNNPIPSAARLSIWLPGLLNLLPGFGTVFPALVTGFLRQNSLFCGKRQAVLQSPGCSQVLNRLRNEELVHTQRAPKTATDYLPSNSVFAFFFTRSIIIQDVPARPSPGAHPFGDGHFSQSFSIRAYRLPIFAGPFSASAPAPDGFTLRSAQTLPLAGLYLKTRIIESFHQTKGTPFMNKVLLLSVLTLGTCFLTSCVAPYPEEAQGERMSIAAAQREIRVGMTSTEVVSVLGAPNMVTTDDQRRETWVYDRISTTVTGSSSSGYASLLLIGTNSSRSRSTTSQRTMTIIIMFDAEGRVRDFRYRQSSF